MVSDCVGLHLIASIRLLAGHMQRATISTSMTRGDDEPVIAQEK
jgi:hypothetical protein